MENFENIHNQKNTRLENPEDKKIRFEEERLINVRERGFSDYQEEVKFLDRLYNSRFYDYHSNSLNHDAQEALEYFYTKYSGYRAEMMRDRYMPPEEAKKYDDMVEHITPFVRNAIAEGKLDPTTYGNHGHLDFNDDDYWGHYVNVTDEGLLVTVYEKNKIKGDPMGAEGERGPSHLVFVKLEPKDIELLTGQLKEKYHTLEQQGGDRHEFDDEEMDGIDMALEIYNKKEN